MTCSELVLWIKVVALLLMAGVAVIWTTIGIGILGLIQKEKR